MQEIKNKHRLTEVAVTIACGIWLCMFLVFAAMDLLDGSRPQEALLAPIQGQMANAN